MKRTFLAQFNNDGKTTSVLVFGDHIEIHQNWVAIVACETACYTRIIACFPIGTIIYEQKEQ